MSMTDLSGHFITRYMHIDANDDINNLYAVIRADVAFAQKNVQASEQV
jgi:site-specific DNA-adenine methylase